MIGTPILGAAAMAILLGAAGAAMAQSQPPHGQPNHWVERFQMIYDTNGDGTVSETEIKAEQNRVFGAVDVDGDGKLSVAEFRRRGRLIMRTGGATLFDLLDVDGDRQVTAEELHGPKTRWLQRYNTDGTAGLGAEELATAFQHRGRMHGRRPRVELDAGADTGLEAEPDGVAHIDAGIDRRRAVRRALRELPERQAGAITLVHYLGLTNAEAAAAMAISVDALESLLRRARLALKRKLEPLARDLLEA